MLHIDWTDEEYRSDIEMLPISGPGKKKIIPGVTRRPFPNFRPVIRISTNQEEQRQHDHRRPRNRTFG